VYCSISGYGSGAGASLPGYDFVVQAVGGLMSITGSPDGEPTKVGVALVDVLTAKDALIGVLAALRARDAAGQGQHVEVNLLSSLLGSLANQASGYRATGTPPGRMGNRHPSIAPYETLHCRDGQLAVACGNDGQFRRLVELLGIPEAAEHPRFARNSGRVEHREELVTLLEERLGVRDAAEWEELLVAADVPAGQVGDLRSAFERATALGLEPIVSPGEGQVPQVAHPIRYSAMEPRRPAAAPRHRQHDATVRGWLGRAGGGLEYLVRDDDAAPV
jgi:formyl-CoA transferase